MPIYSDPTLADSDGDKLSDDEEYDLGTEPFDSDSDNDRLPDGLEVSWWYDPWIGNRDGDCYPDYEEWLNETSPFVYNLTEIEAMKAFAEGAFRVILQQRRI